MGLKAACRLIGHGMLLCLAVGVSTVLVCAQSKPNPDISFQLVPENEVLVSRLKSASLVMAAIAEGEENTDAFVAAAKADYARLLGTLYEHGYYSAVIHIRLNGREAAGISAFETLKVIQRIQVDISTGPPFKFSRAVLSPLAPGTKLAEGFAPGQIAGSLMMKAALASGIGGWRDVGHAKARAVGQRITANHKHAMLDAAFQIAPGPLVRFGPLHITGNDNVRQKRIEEIAGFPQGTQFSPDVLKLVADRLQRTGAFRSVSLREAENLNRDNSLDITASLVEALPRRFGFGAELDSDEGLSLQAYWLHRNILGGAERLRFDAEVSGIGGKTNGTDYLVGATFTRPATLTPDTDLILQLQFERVVEPEYESKGWFVHGGLSHIFTPHLTGEIGVTYEVARVKDDLGDRKFKILSLPTILTYDMRDDRLSTHSGYYISAGLTPLTDVSSGWFGGKVTLDARAYRSFGVEEKTVAAARLQLGSTVGPTLLEAPPQLLFFSGGADTVRGQSYQSLGVDLGGGITSGGRSFAGLSLELRQEITPTIGAVAFWDAGFISAEELSLSNGKWHYGAGLGLRYQTSIGAIRVDLATPLRESFSARNLKLYIGIGQSF